MRYHLIFAIGVAVLAPLHAGADKKKEDLPRIERGPEHKILEGLVGVWDARIKHFVNPDRPAEYKGVMTRTMILGGNFLQESFEGDFAGTKFFGLGIVGFDYHKEKFTTTWHDSISTSMTLTHGTFDVRKKTLTSIGEEVEPNTKKLMKVRDVLRFVNGDEQVLEMYRRVSGEKEDYKIMEVHLKRRPMNKK